MGRVIARAMASWPRLWVSPPMAVEQGQGLSEQKGGQQDPGNQHEKSVPGAEMPQQDQCDHIGQARLDARNGHQGRDGALNGEDGQGECGEEG